MTNVGRVHRNNGTSNSAIEERQGKVTQRPKYQYKNGQPRWTTKKTTSWTALRKNLIKIIEIDHYGTPNRNVSTLSPKSSILSPRMIVERRNDAAQNGGLMDSLGQRWKKLLLWYNTSNNDTKIKKSRG